MLVHQSASIRILDYKCAGRVRKQGHEEHVDGYEVVLPREGIFVRHVNGQSIVADPNYALFFNRGECYRVSHPVEGGDRCTVLAFPTARIRDCLAHMNPDVLAVEAPLFTQTHTPTSPEVDLLHRRLLRAAACVDESLAFEEIAIDLLAWLLSAITHSRNDKNSSKRRAATLRRHRELVAAVREQLSRRLGEKLSLDDLAASVHVSPFHLSRVFRSRTGFSLSAYHRRLRLRTALERILDGEENLTRLAVELGFSHHSHFASAFRREFGSPPSAGRDRLTASELRSAGSTLRYRPDAAEQEMRF